MRSHVEISFLQTEVARLEKLARRRGRALALTGGAVIALGITVAFGAGDVRHQLRSCRAKLVESRQALSALARGPHDDNVAPTTARLPIRETGLRFGVAL